MGKYIYHSVFLITIQQIINRFKVNLRKTLYILYPMGYIRVVDEKLVNCKTHRKFWDKEFGKRKKEKDG